MPMPTFMRVIQYSGFFLSELCHFLLLYLIRTRSSKQFGSYKILMASFSIFSICYAIVEIFTQPIMHISGTGLMLYVDNNFLEIDNFIGYQLAALYCSTFGICVLFLSAHFFYRFSAVCRPKILKMISGIRVFRLFLPIFFLGSLMFFDILWFGQPSEFKSEYFSESLQLLYNDNSSQVGGIFAIFYIFDSTSSLTIFWTECLGILIVILILTFSISTILYFGLKTFEKVQKSTKISKKSADLHRQLFHTLVLQTIIPMCILFAPTGFLLILPFFNVKEVGKIANLPGFGASFFPALDAMIAMIMIRDFRETLSCRERHKKIKINSIHDTMFSDHHYH